MSEQYKNKHESIIQVLVQITQVNS